jgi:hypothetical protein
MTAGNMERKRGRAKNQSKIVVAVLPFASYRYQTPYKTDMEFGWKPSSRWYHFSHTDTKVHIKSICTLVSVSCTLVSVSMYFGIGMFKNSVCNSLYYIELRAVFGWRELEKYDK